MKNQELNLLEPMNRPNGQQCLAKIISVCNGSIQMLIAMKQLYIPVYMNRQDADIPTNHIQVDSSLVTSL